MGIVDPGLLNQTTLEKLKAGGWTPGRLIDGGKLADELTSQGFPVGRRGRLILNEFGGLVCPLPRPVQQAAQSEGRWQILWRFLGVQPPRDPPTLYGGFDHVLNFTPEFIMEGCNPDVLVYCVCHSLGHLVSVVGATSDDRIVLVNENTSVAYVWDILCEVACPAPSFEVVLNGMLGGDYGAEVSISEAPIAVACASDDFVWSEQDKRGYGLR